MKTPSFHAKLSFNVMYSKTIQKQGIMLYVYVKLAILFRILYADHVHSTDANFALSQRAWMQYDIMLWDQIHVWIETT